MLRRDWVRSFGIRLAIVYALLVIPWPGVEAGFSALYRGTTNALFTTVGLEKYLRLDVPAVYYPRGDVELTITNPQTQGRLRIEHGSRDWGFLPLAAGLALTLAIPPPWSGRVRSGIVLMGLIFLFVILRIGVASVYGLGSVRVVSMGPAVLKAIGSFMMGFSATPITSFVVPVILWLLMLYRSFDFGPPRKADDHQVEQLAAKPDR